MDIRNTFRLIICLMGIWRMHGLRLTFPPARDLNDFLDNNLTNTPCGVFHTASSPVTTLAAGTELNVTWSLTIHHIGGYKIQLLRPYSNSSKSRNVWEPQVLEIVNQKNDIDKLYGMRTLTTETLSNWGVMADPISQWAVVDLPMEDCYGCTIRILRQAIDVEANGYYLWSCADVNIATSGVNQCHGCNNNMAPCQFATKTSMWQCACPAKLPYSGTYCERKDECVSDLDCGPVNAKCIDILSSNTPSRQCYCLQGWSGPNCQTRSQLSLEPVVDVDVWEKQYKFKLKSENVSIFWSIIPGPPTGTSSDNREIEVAVAARTNSYVAIGWRPSDLPYTNLPHTSPAEEVSMSTNAPSLPPLDLSFLIAPSPNQEELIPEPISSPDSLFLPEANAPVIDEAVLSPEPFLQEPASLDSALSPSSDDEESSSSSSSSSPSSSPYTSTRSRGLLDDSDSYSTSNELSGSLSPNSENSITQPSFDQPILSPSDSILSPDAEASSPSSMSSDADADTDTDEQTQTQTRTPVQPPKSMVEHEIEDVQHSGTMPLMFSLDVTIAYCRGNYYRIQDAWTYPSFSAPMVDTDLGGTNDISDAIGREEPNGMTYVKFRRPLVPSDVDLDYRITDNNDVTVVWALGQTSNEIQQNFENVSVTKDIKAAVANFYQPDELKYHGKGNSGSFGDTNFILGQPTFNAKFCSNSSLPGYRCALEVDGNRFVVHWKLQQSLVQLAVQAKTRGWFSIGFSPTGKARNSDVILAYAGNGVDKEAFIHSFHILNNTVTGLVKESKLTVMNSSVVFANGTSILRFAVNYTGSAFNISVGANRTTNMIWAISPDDSPNLSNHYLSGRGSFFINFATGDVHIRSNPEKWYWIHGMLMGITFAIIIPLSSIFARSGRVGSNSHKGIASAFHVIFAIIGLVLAIIATFFAFTKFLGNPLRPIMAIHGLSGSILLLLLLFEVLNGLICRPDRKDALRKYWFLPHKLIGMLIFFASLAVAYFGLNRYHQITGRPISMYLILYGGCFVFMLFIYTVLQCCKSTEKENTSLIASEYNLVRASKAGKWPPNDVKWPSNPRHSGNLKRPLRAHFDTDSEMSTDSGILPSYDSILNTASDSRFAKKEPSKQSEISEI